MLKKISKRLSIAVTALAVAILPQTVNAAEVATVPANMTLPATIFPVDKLVEETGVVKTGDPYVYMIPVLIGLVVLSGIGMFLFFKRRKEKTDEK